MIIAGLDPGLSGAIAFNDDGAVIGCQVWDMPVFALSRGGKNKREIDIASLVSILSCNPADHLFIEQVGAMPGQGSSSVFAFGKSYGIVLGVAAALKIPMTLVPPQRWKKALGVPAAKDGARARASQLLPGAAHQWTRVKDDGRAEAALISLFGWRELSPADVA